MQQQLLLIRSLKQIAPSLSCCICAPPAVTHSGMTLAPLVGQLVADEVMVALGSDGSSSIGESNELLAPYRPSREFVATDSGAGLRWAEEMKGATN